MAKLLQINPVIRENTSTGKIMKEIGALALASGWESYIAYSGARDGIKPHSSQLIPVGNKLDLGIHWLATRLFDAHGLASKGATKRFINQIERIQPDIIQIHNLHGYFMNYPILLDFLSKYGAPVVWTVHDCWLYTGHCYHYDAIGCQKWMSACEHCPQKKAFPKSILVDGSKRNFRLKKQSFSKLKNFTLVCVSEWMRDELGKSFLKDVPCRVIHNGIDLGIFRPVDTEDVCKKYGIGTGKYILGIASIWTAQKGLADLVQVFDNLKDKTGLIIVGKVPDEQKSLLPKGAVVIPRTENAADLAAIYSRSSVTLNPTYQDNYPTVNMESVACGTPVVVYNTGGSAESIGPGCGKVVPQGDIAAMTQATNAILDATDADFSESCINFAAQNFSKEARFADYLKLYNELLG